MVDLAVILVFVDLGEEIAIDDADEGITLLQELQRLIDILYLVIMRMGLAIGGYQTIDTESIEVWLVAEITTIGIIAVFKQSLIHPIPDGSTDNAGVGIDHIPILLQIATGVAHGMGILAHHEGFVGHCLGILLQVVGIEIAVIPDATVTTVAVVEWRAGGVERLHLVVHRLDVRAYPTLVAETPKDDARVIEIALHERLGTIHMGLLPGEILAHLLVGIAIAMRLVVGLIHHVEPPTVAKLIEVFTVRIVGGAQEVDVGLLHQPDILLVGGIIDIAACQRMMVMAIHATQLHVLAVDLEDLADNLHLLHTKVVVEMLDDGAFLVEQFHAERIETRLLGRP